MNATTSILEAVNSVSLWLQPFGLNLQCDTEHLSDGQLGEYELGSVFEKTILIRIDPVNIRTVTDDEPELFGGMDNQIHMTICHEVGHAVLEQIIDWMENVPEINSYITTELYPEFEEVFEDSLPEEDLVEDFAWGFVHHEPSPLQEAFEKLNSYISTL